MRILTVSEFLPCRYNNNWRGVGAHRVCTTFYIQDVVERGGCFTYWKGGHQKVHEWWRRHPEEVDGRFTASEMYKSGDHPYQGAGIEGTQHAVKAGTVCVWHGWCPHQASPNASDQPRLALISRWNDNRFVGDNVRMKYGEPEEDGQTTWDMVTDEMRTDPRYTASALPGFICPLTAAQGAGAHIRSRFDRRLSMSYYIMYLNPCDLSDTAACLAVRCVNLMHAVTSSQRTCGLTGDRTCAEQQRILRQGSNHSFIIY